MFSLHPLQDRRKINTDASNAQLPKHQAGFRPGMSTTDQGTILTQDIEDSF